MKGGPQWPREVRAQWAEDGFVWEANPAPGGAGLEQQGRMV